PDVLLEGLHVEDGHLRIECGDVALYSTKHGPRIDGCARDENHVRPVVLKQGQIHERLRWLAQATVLRVSCDANDLEPVLAELDLPSEGIASGPVASRHCLVDDHYPRSSLSIPLIEITPTHQRNAHRLKILRAHGVVVETHVLVFRRRIAVDR